MNLQINYLDKSGKVVASYVTDDQFNPTNVRSWSTWLNDNAVEVPGEPEEWDQFELVAQSTNWRWTGNGRTRAGLTEAQANLLVRIRGGEAVEMPPLEPAVEIAVRAVMPAAPQTIQGAESYYGQGRYTGD